MYVERHDAVPSSSPSLSSLPPSQSGDPFAADEIVELLTDLIHNADSEDDSTALLVEIEDVIVNDVVRSASSTLPSTAPLPSGSADVCTSEQVIPLESLIQATSITLLPILVRFPAGSPETAESLLRLILLVAQRANPKELLVSLEQSLARLALGNDSEDWEEAPGFQFSRILLAARIAIPKVKTRRLASPLRSFLQVLREALTLIGEALDNDDTAAAEADLLLGSTLELLSALAAFTRANEDVDEADKLQVVKSLCGVLLVAGETILPSTSRSAQLASKARPDSCPEPHALQLLATADTLGLDAMALFRDSISGDCKDAHSVVTAVLFAYQLQAREEASPLEEDLALEVLQAFPHLLAVASTTERKRLAATTADGSLYLLRSALQRLRLTDKVITLTGTAVESLCSHLDSLVLHLLAPGITLLAYAVRDFPLGHPTVQDDLLSHLLAACQATHIRSIGIQVLRSMLLEGTPEAEDRIASFSARYGAGLLDYVSPPTTELFMQDKTQTYLVSVINLLYLVYQRDCAARKSDLWESANQQKVRHDLLEPMRADIRRWRQGRTGEKDPDGAMRVAILEDAIDRLLVTLT